MRTPKPLEYYEDCHGCFIVTSHKDKSGGYSKFRRNGKYQFIHRYIYKKHKGEIPKGMLVCHTCDNRNCINPNHLFLGTHKDNAQDSVSKGRWVNVKGEKNGKSKLTEQQVKEIRNSKDDTRIIAVEYDISTRHVWALKTKKSWAWLT